jgi:hypothetical protein
LQQSDGELHDFIRRQGRFFCRVPDRNLDVLTKSGRKLDSASSGCLCTCSGVRPGYDDLYTKSGRLQIVISKEGETYDRTLNGF